MICAKKRNCNIAQHHADSGIVNHRAFLFKVVVNLTLDYFRRQARWSQSEGGAVTVEPAATGC
jgi:hypothetical protein